MCVCVGALCLPRVFLRLYRLARLSKMRVTSNLPVDCVFSAAAH